MSPRGTAMVADGHCVSILSFAPHLGATALAVLRPEGWGFRSRRRKLQGMRASVEQSGHRLHFPCLRGRKWGGGIGEGQSTREKLTSQRSGRGRDEGQSSFWLSFPTGD
jgi:hypothetical protein